MSTKPKKAPAKGADAGKALKRARAAGLIARRAQVKSDPIAPISPAGDIAGLTEAAAANAAGATGLFVGSNSLGVWVRGETLQSDSRPYILYYRGTRYALIGPFGNADEASAWALDKRNNPHDDPRWQVIELAPEHRMPRLATPWEASLAIQAGNL